MFWLLSFDISFWLGLLGLRFKCPDPSNDYRMVSKIWWPKLWFEWLVMLNLWFNSLYDWTLCSCLNPYIVDLFKAPNWLLYDELLDALILEPYLVFETLVLEPLNFELLCSELLYDETLYAELCLEILNSHIVKPHLEILNLNGWPLNLFENIWLL